MISETRLRTLAREQGVAAGLAEQNYVIGENLAEELRYEDTVTRHTSVWSRVFFVATVDTRLVGWTHLDLPQMEKLRHSAQVTVGVEEDYRGYGIGAHLLDRALNWVEAKDYRKIYNSVAATNANAITFLESQGWERDESGTTTTPSRISRLTK